MIKPISFAIRINDFCIKEFVTNKEMPSSPGEGGPKGSVTPFSQESKKMFWQLFWKVSHIIWMAPNTKNRLPVKIALTSYFKNEMYKVYVLQGNSKLAVFDRNGKTEMVCESAWNTELGDEYRKKINTDTVKNLWIFNFFVISLRVKILIATALEMSYLPRCCSWFRQHRRHCLWWLGSYAARKHHLFRKY